VSTYESLDEGQARDALDAAERAGESARASGRRWVRRYLLGTGAATSVATLVIWLIRPWTPPVLWGLALGVLLALLAVWAARQPVIARPKRLIAALLLVWAVVFGLTMSTGPDLQAAYPVGAAVGFAVWATGAWWAGRPKARTAGRPGR